MAETGTEKDRLYRRHAYLVDKRFCDGLDDAERAELAEINRKLDDLEGPFYRPTIDALRGAARRGGGDA
jgi:hypothetical protein